MNIFRPGGILTQTHLFIPGLLTREPGNGMI